MEAIIDSLKKAGKIFYPKTKTKAVYDDNNNRLDNTLTGITDSLNVISNNLTQLQTYSTDEQVVGKWINNKPIYRKVVNIGGQSSANVQIQKTTSEIIPNIDEPLHISGTFIYNNSTKIAFPLSNISSSGISSSVAITFNSDIIRFSSFGYSNPFTKVLLTLEYTKTTD